MRMCLRAGWFSRLLWLLLLLPLAAGRQAAAEGQPGFDAQALQKVANVVAADLMRGIRAATGGGRLKLAVRPFGPDDSLPEDAAGQLNDAIEAALKDAGGDSITILDRAGLLAVWKEADEFQPQATLEQHIKDAGANILVMGELRSVPGGFNLSYKADDLRPGSTGEVLGVMREAHFLPSAFAASTGRPLDEAIRDAAIRMSDRLVEGSSVVGGHLRFQETGETTPFGTYVLTVFLDDVQRELPNAIRRHAAQQAVTGAAAPSGPPPQISFGLTVFDLDKWVDVKFSDDSPDGSSNSSVMTRISMDSIPDNLRPIKPQCGSFVHTVSGEALVGKLLDHAGALRAARSLARARAIAEETCTTLAGAPSVVRDTAEAAWALQSIAGGVTYDESWAETELDGGKRVRAVLKARVRPLGGQGGPVVRAALTTPVVETAVPFGITLTTDTQAYVAIFGWQSDDRVLRLYPFGGQHALPVAAGRELALPRRGDAEFTTEPRPGLTTDFEALIVVASPKPLEYDGLAQEVGATVEESMQRARPVGELFAALAKLQTPLTLTVVPYQIVPKH